MTPCEWVRLPSPLTAEALEAWLLEDAEAEAACEAKRAALVGAWPKR